MPSHTKYNRNKLGAGGDNTGSTLVNHTVWTGQSRVPQAESVWWQSKAKQVEMRLYLWYSLGVGPSLSWNTAPESLGRRCRRQLVKAVIVWQPRQEPWHQQGRFPPWRGCNLSNAERQQNIPCTRRNKITLQVSFQFYALCCRQATGRSWWPLLNIEVWWTFPL